MRRPAVRVGPPFLLLHIGLKQSGIQSQVMTDEFAQHVSSRQRQANKSDRVSAHAQNEVWKAENKYIDAHQVTVVYSQQEKQTP